MILLNHSAAIHIPLALAVLFPLLHVLFFTLVKFKFFPARAWLVLWGLVAIQLVTSFLSYFTGQRDRVFSAADPDLLAQHWELACVFMWLWAAIFVFLPLAHGLRRPTWTAFFHVILVVLLLAQLVYGIWLGQIGGKLVFGA